MRSCGWCALAVSLAVASVVPAAHAQPVPDSTLNWAFGGTVHTVARSGNIVFVGGHFNGVALRRNATGGFAVLSPVTSHRLLHTPIVHGNVNAVISDSAGGWFIGGNFTHIGPHWQPQIAHILPDGRLDLSWTGRVNGRVFALALVGATLYAGGEFTFAGTGGGQVIPAVRHNLAAFDASAGSLLSVLANGTDGRVLGFGVSGATLYAGGEFTTIEGEARTNLAAIDTATHTLTAWNPAPNGGVRAIAPRADGSAVFVGGAFAAVGSDTRAHIAEIDAATGLVTAWNPAASGHVRALALAGSTVYVGGEFTTLGSTARNNIGALDATTGATTAWDPNADAAITAISVAGSLVYIGGEFVNVAGRRRLHAAAVEASTGVPNGWHPALNDPVRAIVATATTVALGGSFEATGGYHRRNLAAIDLENGRLLPWNPRPDGPVHSLAVGADDVLYLGGNFTAADQQARDRLAAFNLATLTLASWNPGADAVVRTIAPYTDGATTTVFVGGDFASVGGHPRTRIAAIDAASGGVLGSFAPGVTDDSVLALAVDQTHVYVGGRFTLVGGGASAHLGRVDRMTGAFDAAWTPAPDGDVRALDLNGATLYAGGSFAIIAGAARDNVAALGLATPTAASDWQPNPDGPVNAIATEGPFVFIGGAFRRVDSILRPRLAGLLAAATGSGPYLIPWRPRWFGSVHDLDSAPDGLVAVGEALPDLDDQEPDPVGRAAFFPQAGAGVPGAPTSVTTERRAGGLTLLWHAPIRGPRPLRYVLFAGTGPGLSNLASGIDVGGGTLIHVPAVGPGTYYIRLRAIGVSGLGPVSHEAMVTVGPAGCAAPPEPPQDLVAAVNGGTVTLTWMASPSTAIGGYRLQAGTAPGQSSFAQMVSADMTTFSAAAPPGVFYARVVAVGECGESSSSNEVTIGVGGVLLPPGAPRALSATFAGSGVHLAWAGPATGGLVTSYLLEVGVGPGMSDLGELSLGGSSASFANVPPGTYYLRLRARNAAGAGPASAEVVLVVP